MTRNSLCSSGSAGSLKATSLVSDPPKANAVIMLFRLRCHVNVDIRETVRLLCCVIVLNQNINLLFFYFLQTMSQL